jgi:hypothetical protein
MARRRGPHRPLTLDSTHWRQDGQPKVRFRSQAEALGAAEDRTRESGVELGVYQCGFCGGWHMGRRSGRLTD